MAKLFEKNKHQISQASCQIVNAWSKCVWEVGGQEKYVDTRRNNYDCLRNTLEGFNFKICRNKVSSVDLWKNDNKILELKFNDIVHYVHVQKGHDLEWGQ